MSEPAVEQQVAVAAADMPDVAAIEGLDPRFMDQRHAVAETDGFVPVLRGNGQHQRDKSTMSAGEAKSSTVSPTDDGLVRAQLRNEGYGGILCRQGRDALEAALEHDVGHSRLAQRDGPGLGYQRDVLGADRQRDIETRFAGAGERKQADLRVDPDLVHAKVEHLAGQQRQFAHEGRAEARCGPRIDAFGRPLILDAAVIHDDAVVGERHRLFLVVRDMDEGGADALLQRLQFVLHLAAKLQVERAERLVEQQDGGLDDQRARQRHALPLAAGQLVRHLAVGIRQPDHRQRFARAADAFCARHAAHPEAKADIVADAADAGRAHSPGTRWRSGAAPAACGSSRCRG